MGEQAKYEDYITYNFPMYHNLPSSAIREVINTKQTYLNLMPIEGALVALKTLKEKGFIIDLVTARGGYDNAEIQTKVSLANLDIHYDSLTLIDSSKNSKSDYYKHHLGNLAFIADDAPVNIIDAARSNTRITPFCIAAPWNNTRGVLMHAKERVSSLLNLSEMVQLA